MMRSTLWNIPQLREQLSIFKGEAAPTIVLKNATYLNSGLKAFETANIWIYQDRIIYVGEMLPNNIDGTEVVDCTNITLVPGYIEPHVHPGQLYNPQTLMAYASQTGTTTLISDNLGLFMLNDDDTAFKVMDRLAEAPVSMYWWCRYDAQTLLLDNDLFTDERISRWLLRPDVVQGGELTFWPQVLHGDDQILKWMLETKALGKPIESHLPGSSEKTLTQLILLGASCDHEAMTGVEAIRRMRLGLTTSLRYSSIRPDLPKLLEEMLAAGITNFENVYMTTDGATPAFYEQGIMDRTIQIALEKGVPIEDAYMMASTNIAKHYNYHELLGSIAPGRIAHINFLKDRDHPTPLSVLAKGIWVKRDGQNMYPVFECSFGDFLPNRDIPLELEPSMLNINGETGIDMVNSVITKPFDLNGISLEILPENCHYLSLIDRSGNWGVNTIVRGFATHIDGFASSYSNTGDIILIGKNHEDMIAAFRHIKKMGGGFALAEKGKIVGTVHLPLFGGMSDKPMELLIEEEKAFRVKLGERGYHFEDPVYSLFFFSSIHLPYIRITQKGIVDVMKGQIITPATWFNTTLQE